MTKALLVFLAAVGSSTFAQGTMNYMDDFSNPASAARFTVSGSGSFDNGALSLSPGSSAILNAGIFSDNGQPIIYSVTETFSNTTQSSAEFRVRGTSGNPHNGYFIRTATDFGRPYIALNRRTAAESPFIGEFTLVGGPDPLAPPILATPGPYKLSVSLLNKPSSVSIGVWINDVLVITADDSSPFRLMAGDSFGFYSDGSQTANFDNINVASVPEPAAYALFMIGLLAIRYKIRR